MRIVSQKTWDYAAVTVEAKLKVAPLIGGKTEANW